MSQLEARLKETAERINTALDGLLPREQGPEARLLGAMGAAAQEPQLAAANGGGHWLKVRVTDSFTGKQRVNVTLPLGLVQAAMRIGSRFVPEREREIVNEVSVALRDGLTGRIVDVLDEEDGERVEVYIE